MISYGGYQGDFTLTFSDGNKFLIYRPTPLFRFIYDASKKPFPFEDLKMAFIKPPAGFANCSFFDRPDVYLALIEKNGRWHPVPVRKNIDWHWVDNLYEVYPYDINFVPPI